MATRTRKQAAAMSLAEIAAAAGDVEMPAQKRVVESRKWDQNPFVETLRALVAEGSRKGKAVTVPAHQAREVAGGVRDAAEKLTAQGTPTGVRLIYRYTNDEGTDVQTTALATLPDDERPVMVMYAARDRRRTLTDEQRAEASQYADAFLGNDGKINGRRYLEWKDAGSPTDSEGWPLFGKSNGNGNN
jgi:hypothetical protein